jgi:hypothetical protein
MIRLTCGQCFYGKPLQQSDKRLCYGVPPTPVIVQDETGKPSIQTARAIVDAEDDSCALFKQQQQPLKMAADATVIRAPQSGNGG